MAAIAPTAASNNVQGRCCDCGCSCSGRSSALVAIAVWGVAAIVLGFTSRGLEGKGSLSQVDALKYTAIAVGLLPVAIVVVYIFLRIVCGDSG